MRIFVKEWWYQKEQTKAQHYNWTLCWEKAYEDERGNRISERMCEVLESKGEQPLFIGYSLCGNIIKETEKAVQYELAFWNLNRAGRYVNDAPVETRWKTWVPKSVLL